MKFTRRRFLKASSLAGFSVFGGGCSTANMTKVGTFAPTGEVVILSTWRHGIKANEAAASVLKRGGSALDAVESGVRVSESDPEVMSVGYGGLPNEEGVVELDASIMWGAENNAGAVANLRGIKNPISVARRVMEKTRHVMLVGEGALRFALAEGFEEEDLLTEKAKNVWLKWKQKRSKRDNDNVNESHDTIGMVAIDSSGNIAGACTTSGLAWKMPGRVGDSPIIGAGMYVDNEVGAAAATGVGEEVIKICGSFLVVELMRQGMTPQKACEEACRRIVAKHGGNVDFQDAFIALRKDGMTGAASILKNFRYALHRGDTNELYDGKHLL